MEQENIIIIALVILIGCCIIGAGLYFGLASTNSTQSIPVNNSTNLTNNTSTVVANSNDDASSSQASSSGSSKQVSSSSSAQEDTYQKYDPDDYIYGADGEKAYWVSDDGYDGSYQPAEYTNGPQ